MRARPEEHNAIILAIVETTRNAAEAARLASVRLGTKLTAWSVNRLAKANGVELTEGRKVRLQNLAAANAEAQRREQSSERLKALWQSAEFRRLHTRGIRNRTKRQARCAAAGEENRIAASPAPAPT